MVASGIIRILEGCLKQRYMKTNQIMKRKLGAITVLQRTKDAYFNATELVNCYNSAMSQTVAMGSVLIKEAIEKAVDKAEEAGLQASENQQVLNTTKRWELELVDNDVLMNIEKRQEKRLDVFLKTVQTNDFIESIARNEGLAISDVVKSNRGKYGGTWVHPLLFIDLCMWLDANFKYQALKFVQDEMLAFRDKACEAYKELSAAVAKITTPDTISQVMKTVAKALNFIMWNRHEEDERNNHATEAELSELFVLEHHIASTIDDGFLSTSEELIDYLRKKWAKKWCPIRQLSKPN